MHLTKASLQSLGFHGKLITIIRPLLLVHYPSAEKRIICNLHFTLLLTLLEQASQRLDPDLCFQLAPFHHNYIAEQNQAPRLERVHQTSNYCFTTGCKSLSHFLKELSDLLAFHFTCICQRCTFVFYSCYVSLIWETFHATCVGPKAKTPNKGKPERMELY